MIIDDNGAPSSKVAWQGTTTAITKASLGNNANTKPKEKEKKSPGKDYLKLFEK